MKRKILSILLAIVALVSVFALAACDITFDDGVTDNITGDDRFGEIYGLYVDYAASNGKTPLSYSDWLDSIRGEDGKDGKDGKDGANPNIGYNGNWWIGNVDTGVTAIPKDGKDGKDGVGIAKIEKVSSQGLVDTYEITYTTGTKFTFTITNGANGTSSENGKDGVGIAKFEKISSEGLVDTYEITYTDGTKFTFTITNGANGTDGQPISCSHTYGDWIVICEPSCDCIGVNYRVCSQCNEVEHDYIEKLGHTMVDVATLENTCTVHTVMTKCSLCNTLFMEDREIEANHSYSNGVCAVCGYVNPDALPAEYTYNTSFTSSPSSINPHTYQTSNSSAVLEYTNSTLYAFDFNEIKDGFVIVPEMAASMPIDVTANFVGEKWGISAYETSRAWLIELRDDLTWEDGTRITAYDFVESAKRLLDPKALNYRADQLFNGYLTLVNAKAYFRSGRTIKLAASDVYDVYSTDLDSKLIFTLDAPSAATDNAECAMRTYMGFPASYKASHCAAYLIANYLGECNFTAETAAAMEGKTFAEIKADPILAAAWADLIGWWQTEPNDELHFFIANNQNAEVNFDDVGIIALSDTELVIILEEYLDGFYLNYSLVTDLGLVHVPTYDACAYVDENGIYTNTYGTSTETFMSFGPYKLVEYQTDNKIVLEKNDNWYGYSDSKYEGQYQTTRIVFTIYDNNTQIMDAFTQGDLDYVDLNSDTITDYVESDNIYYTDGSSTWFIALNPNEEAFKEWEEKNPGKDKSILGVKEFRMALSFSLNRQEFINTLDPVGSIGLALFNNMICSDPENGIMYRTEDAAKDAILEFWGISKNDIGAGKLYPTKDAAIASITGYNLAGAKELFNRAYDIAVESGIYNGIDTIEICIGTPNATSKFYTQGYEFLKNNYTKAVEGTKLEGKLTFTNNNTLSNGFADALRANVVDMLFGVGWSGSQLNPYGLIGAYTYEDYQYDPSWDTSEAMMQFTIDGVVYEASILQWTYAIEGNVINIRNAITGSTKEYSCGYLDANNHPGKQAERVRLLAALEGAVLRNYNMIPTHNQASASLLSYKVNYGVKEQVFGIDRGGVRYMTYNYSDAEWEVFVNNHNGNINYK